jgi:hypothetical protein
MTRSSARRAKQARTAMKKITSFTRASHGSHVKMDKQKLLSRRLPLTASAPALNLALTINTKHLQL